MTSTSSLNLQLFTPNIDLNKSFESLRADLNGPTNSNMTKFDSFAGNISLLLSSSYSSASSSILPLNNFANFSGSASGSIANIKSASAQISASFLQIGVFSGSGQADFSGLNQSYNNILIIGQAQINNVASGSFNIACDFNGDLTGLSYIATNWVITGSGYSTGNVNTYLSNQVETFSTYTGSQIILANVSASPSLGFGGLFYGIIPNYSANGGFYKNAMGIYVSLQINSSSGSDMLQFSLGKSGGMYMSACPITRIRIFGSDNAGNRYNFSNNTVISLYGLI